MDVPARQPVRRLRARCWPARTGRSGDRRATAGCPRWRSTTWPTSRPRCCATRAPTRGSTYDLTGPEAFTLAEAAERAGAATGRELRYVEETLEEAYRSREVYGAPRWQVDAWVSTYTAIAAGEVAGVSGDVERVLGRAPRSLEDVLGARA